MDQVMLWFTRSLALDLLLGADPENLPAQLSSHLCAGTSNSISSSRSVVEF